MTIRISALYANRPGSRFDGDYYINQHEPLASKLLAPHGLEGVSTVFGVAALDGGEPPFWAISEMLFASRAAFDAAMAACGEALFADIPNYTDVTPVLQVSSAENPANHI